MMASVSEASKNRSRVVSRLIGLARLVSLVALLGSPSARLEAQSADGGNEAPETFLESIKQGTFSLGLRLRGEHVEQDSFDDDADALSLRTQLGFKTKTFRGVSLQVVAEDLSTLGSSTTFNNRGVGAASNGVTDRPVIADPDGTELSQFVLTFTGLERATFRVGRMELALDDQRFVGPVGWRQNHQELDAAQVIVEPNDDWTIQYAALDAVHTIVRGRDDIAGHLFNVQYRTGLGPLAAYAYLLDYDDAARFALSSSTLGLRWTGKSELGSGSLLWTAELANQTDHGDNPRDIDLGYRRGELGYSQSALTARVGFELLEGDGAFGFRTPLATLHKFNGWADLFLATPANGLRDLYVSLAGSHGQINWLVAYHDFESDRASQSFGTEIDAQLVLNTSWKQQFAVKLAAYDADEHAVDTTKIWVWTSWGF